MTIDEIKEIKSSLDKINFNNILHEKEYKEKGSHNYNKEKHGNSQHEYCEAEPYCTLCDTECNKQEIEGINYTLRNMSHGTHTLDFLYAGEDFEAICKDIENWDDHPVLFLFENPSIDYDIYAKGEKSNAKKRPPTRWYWIYESDFKDFETNTLNSFKKQKYGAMVYALIRTFKLSNAYMTNVVKCGMNDDKDGDKFLTTKDYNPECINTCLKNILLEEITALTYKFTKPLTIFAFGRRTENLILSALKTSEYKEIENTKVWYMPHPAAMIKNNDRKNTLLKNVSEELKIENDEILKRVNEMKNSSLE